MLVLAGLVGLYGGLAAGLFTTAIAVLRIVFFRTEELSAFLAGDAVLRSRFDALMEATRWRPELAGLGLLVAAAVIVYGFILRRRQDDVWGQRLMTVAVVGGAGLVLFYSLLFLSVIDRTFLRVDGGLLELVTESPWWLVLLAPAAGGLGVGVLIHRFSPESRGHGVGEVLEAVAAHGSRIPAKTAVFKGLTAAMSIASGGSVGREGPVVQIGSAVGSSIGQRLRVSRAQLRTLVGAGAAAGIAASFDAPIAGAMFALEIILADFGIATFSPIVLSSVLATVVSRAILQHAHIAAGDLVTTSVKLGPQRDLVQTAYSLVSPYEIGPYLLLGLVCGVVALAYVASMDRAEGLFAGKWGGRLGQQLAAMPMWIKPAIGGLLVGLMGLGVPQVMGTGYETMNAALHESLEIGLVLAILVGKIVATSLTLGSGGSGGSFFPAVFVGAMTGTAFGTVLHSWLPTVTAGPGAYALVGMGAVVAGATQAPLTGIIMMFELTGDYQIILPLMVACLGSSLLVNRWLHHSMYTLKLAQKGLDHRAGQGLELLRRIPVRDAMNRRFAQVPRDMPYRQLVDHLTHAQHGAGVVVDEQGDYLGLVSLHDVNAAKLGDRDATRRLAGELVRQVVTPLAEDDDLQTALERMSSAEVDQLPVMAQHAPGRIAGVLSRRDIMLVYGQARANPGEELTPGPAA